MGRKKEIDGNKFLKFRVSTKMYEFIKRVSQELGISISETCRSALQLFFMGVALGKFKGIEDEFWKRVRENRKEKTDMVQKA